mmetsp:Transcript_118283/g.228295  ORF Transcript_118283/g.228295 Transcript_118283/m.228295 type:complete len:122 (+) Transcript_118283:1341-1706(+)
MTVHFVLIRSYCGRSTLTGLLLPRYHVPPLKEFFRPQIHGQHPLLPPSPLLHEKVCLPPWPLPREKRQVHECLQLWAAENLLSPHVYRATMEHNPTMLDDQKCLASSAPVVAKHAATLPSQ